MGCKLTAFHSRGRWPIAARMILGLLVALFMPFTAAFTQDINSCLIEAAENGQSERVISLLNAGAEANAKTRLTETALMLASAYGQTETVKVVLANGAKVNEKFEGVTILRIATGAGHAEVVRALLNAGAKVDGKARDGMTTLMAAARNGHLLLGQAPRARL